MSAGSIDWDAIPDELHEVGQWVPWKFEARAGKQTKVPYRADSPARRGSSKDPQSWGTFEAVRQIVEAGDADGVGFVVTARDAFAGIDIDNCVDPKTGGVSPLARTALSALD